MNSQLKNDLLGSLLLATLVVACPTATAKPQYPPAFKSEIVYQDTDYIAKGRKDKATEAAKFGTSQRTSNPSDDTSALAEMASDVSKGQVDVARNDYYLLGSIVPAVLFGLFFYGNKPSKPVPLTRVAQYIARRDAAVTGTSVAKYLHYRGY